MDNETFSACQLAIRERIKAIDSRQSRNSPQSDRAGLVQIGFAVRLLARRYLQAPVWPGHEVTDDVRLHWELAWYMNYIQATAEVCKAAQVAVREKRLTLRSQLTRTPLAVAALESWLNMDIDAAISEATEGFLPRLLELCPLLGGWPDALGIPPGAADVQDIAAWAAGDGLASVDEALSLLAGTAPVQATAVVAETKEQRQDRRLNACIDAGLPMRDKAALSRLPDGVGDVADREGVSRQAFSIDVKAALERLQDAKREGVTLHRA